MKASTLAIVSDIKAAKSYVDTHQTPSTDVCLTTTHPGVTDFFAAKGIECADLSGFVSVDDIRNEAAKMNPGSRDSHPVVHTLRQLDKTLGTQITNTLGLPALPLFQGAYGYFLLTEYMCSRHFIKAVKHLVCKTETSKIALYGTTQWLSAGILNEKVIIENELLEDMGLELTYHPIPEAPSAPRQAPQQKRFALRETAAWARKQLKKMFAQRTGKTVLLIEALYDLDFLKSKLDCKTILFPRSVPPSYKASSESAIDAQLKSILASFDAKRFTAEGGSSFPDTYISLIAEDFSRNGASWLQHYLYAKSLIQEQQPDMAVWGNSPIVPSKNWIISELLSKNTPVVGMQHGSHYGTNDTGYKHYLLDFKNCTHYLSYGFTQEDLNQLYSDYSPIPKVIPVGTTKQFAPYQSQEQTQIDVLFPISIGHSMLMDREMPAHDLAMIQHKICDTLESRTDLTTVIKTIKKPTEDKLFINESLKQLTHCKVVYTEWLAKFLRKNAAKLVVLEYHSTPLYEVMELDCDIFLLLDEGFPFTNEALELLKKRVFCFENIDDLLLALKNYPNDIPRLRDDSFYKRYVAKANTEEAILSTIDDILQGRQ